MTTICNNCEDYKEFTARINAIISLQNVRQGKSNLLGDDYKYFKFCPWCGEELEIVEGE